jgi:hypothetical protein
MAVSRLNWILGIVILVGMVVVSGIGGFNLLSAFDPAATSATFWLMTLGVIFVLMLLWHFLDTAGWLDRAAGHHVKVTRHHIGRDGDGASF